ncbi:MAG: LAGLIDADG family homing endonuclease [Candidatus Omnitrophica bacterium]|nr:LAGLIDADG family homing endonuclease [Candidatus Omnitrophota bacterium]
MKHDINYKWNSNLAYAIGLIATDGNLSKDRRHILFTTTDHQLANTFKECLGIKNKTMTTLPRGFGKKNVYRINFGNVKFYQWLQKIGLMPKKTMLMGKLDIPNQYFIDFLRGHLDGDGSVFTYTDRYMKYKGKTYTYHRLYTKFISTNFNQIKWIRDEIKNRLDIVGSLTHYLKINREFPIWQLRFAKNDSLKLLSWIYYKPNLPCLNRKRKIAEEFLLPFSYSSKEER